MMLGHFKRSFLNKNIYKSKTQMNSIKYWNLRDVCACAHTCMFYQNKKKSFHYDIHLSNSAVLKSRHCLANKSSIFHLLENFFSNKLHLMIFFEWSKDFTLFVSCKTSVVLSVFPIKVVVFKIYTYLWENLCNNIRIKYKFNSIYEQNRRVKSLIFFHK